VTFSFSSKRKLNFAESFRENGAQNAEEILPERIYERRSKLDKRRSLRKQRQDAESPIDGSCRARCEPPR